MSDSDDVVLYKCRELRALCVVDAESEMNDADSVWRFVVDAGARRGSTRGGRDDRCVRLVDDRSLVVSRSFFFALVLFLEEVGRGDPPTESMRQTPSSQVSVGAAVSVGARFDSRLVSLCLSAVT